MRSLIKPACVIGHTNCGGGSTPSGGTHDGAAASAAAWPSAGTADSAAAAAAAAAAEALTVGDGSEAGQVASPAACRVKKRKDMGETAVVKVHARLGSLAPVPDR